MFWYCLKAITEKASDDPDVAAMLHDISSVLANPRNELMNYRGTLMNIVSGGDPQENMQQ